MYTCPFSIKGGIKPIEEGKKQSTDMTAVYIGIGHTDDFMVSQLGYIKVAADSRSKCGNHGLDFFISQDSVQPGFFHVQYLPAQGKNCLVFPFPALLGRAAGRVLTMNISHKAGSFRSNQPACRAGMRFPVHSFFW